ncbi:unnamed protein product [Rotaria magnacalcarata]|uniref:Uncharacterized protein n=4 Tax=Rotaria magnacalcarata TaxID=392030 RepID=A0A816LRK0_9BILA|nr:unnamed protein product [Rotaria magnacalcarata]CAF1682080.1 unnamed protein product [Rotaria magnacalcarata]CAF1953061.1 unnamed protein product [Rotaria magnacalcarata]
MKESSAQNNNTLYSSTHSRESHVIEQSKIINNYNNEISYDSRTLNMIRSIVEELYQINNEENQSTNEPNERRAHFTLKHEIDKTKLNISNELELTKLSIKNTSEKQKSTIRYQPVLSDSTAIVCCLHKGRSKIDRCVSTDDRCTLQCECATQTMNITNLPEYNHSPMTLLTGTHDGQTRNDSPQSRSHITLSTTSISSKSTDSDHPSSLPTLNHENFLKTLAHPCENDSIVPSLNIAHQLRIPTQAKIYDLCQEQTLENDDTFMNLNMNIFNCSSQLNNPDILSRSNKRFSDENMTKTNLKYCTCSKQNLPENDFSMLKFTLPNQDKSLKELHVSKRSLQLMHNDNLFYVRDLVLVFRRNISQFYEILLKRYYLSKTQAKLFVKIMNNWWKKHQTKFIALNEK